MAGPLAAHLDVRGMPELGNYFYRVAVGVDKGARKNTQAACRRLVARAKSLCPVRTGNLRDSIEYVMRGPTLGVVGVTPKGFYWYFVEFGTIKSAAHPFMRPAAEATWGAFWAEMVRDVDAAVQGRSVVEKVAELVELAELLAELGPLL